jgi:predicted MPP superfamily phosphohydrolase
MRRALSGRPFRAGSSGRIALGTAAAAGALLAATLAYARWVEPRRLQAVAFLVGVPGLPPALEGVRIAHLTDFHAGAAGSHLPTLRRAVAVARRWRPDLVALTGDFADDGHWRPDLHLF